MIKKFTAIMLLLAIMTSITACSYQEETTEYRIHIVTSMFPYYDIASHLADEIEGVGVQLAVSPGLDSHTFEPTPKDIQKIEQSDILIYNGGTMEEWVQNVLGTVNRQDKMNICMMEAIDPEKLLQADERQELYGEIPEEEDEEEEIDEHLWTSPILMMEMTDVVLQSLCEADPANEKKYQENAKNYKEQLKQLDVDFRKVTENALIKEFIFADKFPLLYFAQEYGLTYHAAFPGCSSDMEPSAKTVAFLEDKINEEKVNAIFYLELSSRKVADTIREDTGVEVLQFHTCHNVTQKQFDEGVTYMELMKNNLENLQIALN